MQIYVEVQRDSFFLYALERIMFMQKREATNFRLMTQSLDQSSSNELVT